MANQVPQMRPKVVTTRIVEIDGRRQTVRTCNEPGCARTHLAQGLCATCYQRVRYQVDPAVAERKREQMRRWRAGSANQAFREQPFQFPEDRELEAEFIHADGSGRQLDSTGYSEGPQSPAEVPTKSTPSNGSKGSSKRRTPALGMHAVYGGRVKPTNYQDGQSR